MDYRLKPPTRKVRRLIRLSLLPLIAFLAIGNGSTSRGQGFFHDAILADRTVGNTGPEPTRQIARRAEHLAQPSFTGEFNEGEHGEFRPWWRNQVYRPLWESSPPLPVTLESLIASAIEHSAQVRVFSDQPLIRETTIVEADATFDWAAFMETKWNDISEPVGNVLTTGGPTRFNDHKWDYSAGLRRKTKSGGSLEFSQRLGFENSNSNFFIPQDQGTSRLTLGFSQPLLRGAGKVYNTSLVVLAQIDTEISEAGFSAQLQAYLLDLTQAYWDLYLQRASLLQRRRSYGQAVAILNDLEHRRLIDAVSSQIVRAQAAVATRRADLLRTQEAIRNDEGRIRTLVNDPDLGIVDQFELTPMDTPAAQFIPIQMKDSLTEAIQNRPEVDQAMKEIKASAVRLNMSKNELLPVLDVVLESYVAGLQGQSDIGRAFEDQFSEGAPSYSAGFVVEVPIHNRAARARYQRRALELRQVQSQFEATVENLKFDAEMAVRDVETSYGQMKEKYGAMQAAGREVANIEQRWKLLPGDDRSAALVLEDLLSAQDRLLVEEIGFATAQVDYSIALLNLKRATGTLLQHEQITLDRAVVDGLPALLPSKPEQRTDNDLFPPPPTPDDTELIPPSDYAP